MSSQFDPTLFGAVFVTLFVIMDPLGNIPLFLGLTGGRSNRTRAKLAGQAVLVSLFVITLFAIVGQQILDFLGIGIPALQGAGGLLLLIVALELLTDRADEPSEVRDVNVALVPLGTPLLAGPGAIVAGRLPVPALQRRHHAGHPRERDRAADPHRRAAAVGHRRAARRRLGAWFPRRGVRPLR